MKNHDSEIPERLLEYRKKLGMRQLDFCKMLAVSQNYYTLLETGRNSLSYNSLEHFLRVGGDVNYILTGEPYCTGIAETCLESCEDLSRRNYVLQQMLLMAKIEFSEKGIGNIASLNKAEKFIIMMETHNPEDTIWRCIRYVDRLSQIMMAEKLEIDVKRYRRIENLTIKPGADVLCRIYHKLGYSPLIILNRSAYYTNEINKAWNTFSDSQKKRFCRVIEATQNTITENNENTENK